MCDQVWDCELAGQLIFYTHPMSTAESQVDAQRDRAALCTELPDYDTTTKAAAYLAINPMDTAVTATLMCPVRVGSSAIGAWIGSMSGGRSRFDN